MRRSMTVLLVMVLVFALAVPVLAVAKAAPVFVSHPSTAKQTYKAGLEFRAWGYVTPKASDLTSRTIDILVYKRGAHGKYTLVTTIAGTLFNTAKYKHSTRYNAMLSLDVAGRYRMRARYGWKGAGGLTHYRNSSYKYFRVK